MLVFVVIAGVFAGCGTVPDVSVTEDMASPFSIYRREDGHIISIGDTRDEVAPVLGPDEMHVVEFMEEEIERVQYWDNDQVHIDFLKDNTICAIRFTIDEWKIFNGMTVGMSEKDVRERYPEEHIFQYPQTNDLWIAYDENGNTTRFSDEAPYIVRFRIKEKNIDLIMIQDNTVQEGIF